MQSLIDIPQKCLAYSANWYLNQISAYDVSTDLFAYGSNSDIYIINYKQKKYETILYNSNMREKISCVQFLTINMIDQDQNDEKEEIQQNLNKDIIILAGSTSGTFYIYSYNQQSKRSELLEQQNIVLNQTIVSIHVDNNQFNKYVSKIIIQLQNGSIFHLQYDLIKNKTISLKINIQQTKSNLKLKFSSCLSGLNSQHNSSTQQPSQNKYTINFFEEGQIFLYENNNKIFTHQIEGKILTLDEIPNQSAGDHAQRYILLKKIKNYIFLNLIEIEISFNKNQNVSKNNQTSQKTDPSSELNERQENLIEENSEEVIENKMKNEEIQQKNQQGELEEKNEISMQEKSDEKQKNKFEVKSIVDIEIFFIYSKKNIDLLQSSFTIKSLDYDNFILTGKMGDIYIFNINKFVAFSKKNQKLTINPLSAQYDDTYYSKVPDTNHYDGIFTIQTVSDQKLITLSIDRRISFFKINKQTVSSIEDESIMQPQIENQDETEKEEQNNQSIPYQLEFEWQLSCLGAKVNSLANSQVEKELIYMSCLDHTVRVWDSSKTHDQLYVKEYYKRIDQLNVKQMLLHPQFENIMVLFLQDNPKKLVGYDLFKEKISFEYTSNRDILNLKWIKKEYADELQNILFESASSLQQNSAGKQDKQGQEKALQKQIKVERDHIETKEKGLLAQNDDHYLLVFKKGGFLSLINLADCTISIEDYLICENKNNVQQLDLEIVENQIFAVFAQLGCISFYCDYQYKQFQNMHKNVVKSIAFKQTQEDNSRLIIACACLDRRISVYAGNTNDVSSFQFITYLKHEYPIEKVMFSPIEDCYYLLSIAQNHNTLQIHNLQPNHLNELAQQLNNNNTIAASGIDKNESDEENEETSNEIKPETLNKPDYSSQDQQNKISNQTNKNNNQLISLEYKNIRGHRGYINDAIFSPLDKNLLITCSDDQTVKFWSIDTIIHKSYPKRKKNKNNNNNNKKPDESFLNATSQQKPDNFNKKNNNNNSNQNFKQNKFKQNQNNNQQQSKYFQNNKFNKKSNNN